MHAFMCGGRSFFVAMLLGAAALAAPAQASVFDVKGSDVTKGETEIGTNSAFFNGFPENADRLRSSHELAIGYGFTDWLKAGAKLSFDHPADEGFRLSTAGIETQIMFKKFEGGLGLGWFTGVDVRVHRDETNTATFGPVIQLGTEQTQLLLNPFFAKTFGPNREEGIEFSYAWAIKQLLREGFSIGIEGYGSIPDIGHHAGIDFQEHRIGPVVYYERSLGGGRGNGRGLSIKDVGSKVGDKDDGGPKLAIEAGVLFGLTEGTQDTAFKFKAGITF